MDGNIKQTTRKHFVIILIIELPFPHLWTNLSPAFATATSRIINRKGTRPPEHFESACKRLLDAGKYSLSHQQKDVNG